MKVYETADFVAAAAATPTQAESVAFIAGIFTDFNQINPTYQVTPLTNAEIQTYITGALSAAMILNVTNAVIDRFNTYLDAAPIPNTATAATGFTTAITVAYINANFVAPLNRVISKLTFDVMRYNTGFRNRKDLLFNPIPNIMSNANAGRFSFNIPLSYIFSFCDDYRKVIFNAKHQLQLQKIDTTGDAAIFKDIFVGRGKIVLSSLRWYMPNIIPSNAMKAVMYKQIKEKIPVPIGFMNKKCDIFNNLNGLSTYTAQITYSGGIEKPRYLVAAFQTLDLLSGASPNALNDPQNINYSIFNGTNLNGNSYAMIDVSYIKVQIGSNIVNVLDLTPNNFSLNQIARWYNEFKKFKMSYMSNFEEDDMLTLNEFRNLYRLYVIDISKQTESITVNSVPNVSLEFQFNGALPNANQCQITLYVVSFFDRVLELASDGTKQYILK